MKNRREKKIDLTRKIRGNGNVIERETTTSNRALVNENKKNTTKTRPSHHVVLLILGVNTVL